MNIAVLIIFAIVLIILGWIFGDSSTPEAFAMADRKARAIFVAFGAFTVVGASTFIGVTQFTYYLGGYAAVLGIGAGIGAYLLGKYGSEVYKESYKLKLNTLPDSIAHRYGIYSGSLATIISVLTLGALLIIQISVAGIIIANLTNIALWITSLMLVIVVAVYIYTGGLKAIFITDILQGIGMFILIGGSLIAIYFVGLKTPDISIIAESPLELNNQNINLLVVLFFTGFLSITGGADVWLRFFSADSAESAKKGLHIGALLFITFLIILTYFGLHVVAQLPDADPADAFVIYITTILPNWLMPFIVMGILSASLSTADAEAHVISSMLVTEKARWNHRIKKTKPSNFDKTKDLSFARWASVIILLIAYIFSIDPDISLGNVFNAFLTIIMIMGASAWMLILGRGNNKSMFWGLLTGLSIFCILFFKNILFEALWSLLIPLPVILFCIFFKRTEKDD